MRGERKKWIHIFDRINLLIYVVNCGNFHLKIYEDFITLSLDESIDLFKNICSSHWNITDRCIVVFNKIDKLEENLAKHPFKVQGGLSGRSNDYSGPSLEDGLSVEMLAEEVLLYLTDVFQQIFETKETMGQLKFCNINTLDSVGFIEVSQTDSEGETYVPLTPPTSPIKRKSTGDSALFIKRIRSQ